MTEQELTAELVALQKPTPEDIAEELHQARLRIHLMEAELRPLVERASQAEAALRVAEERVFELESELVRLRLP